MMRLPSFRYFEPKTLEEALRIRQETGPKGAYVAGGTDLYPNMKRRQQTPKVVVSLARIRELRQKRLSGIADESQGREASGACRENGSQPGFARRSPLAARPTDGWSRLGAGLTLTEVCEDPEIRRLYPGLARAISLISTPPLRNMGTIGGNLLLDTRCNYYDQNYEWRKAINFCMKKDGAICWVAPASRKCLAVQSADAPPVLIAMGAKVRLLSPDLSERVVPLEALYRDDGIDYATKAPDELLTEILLPEPDGWRATYWKLRRRGSFDFPVLSVGACVHAPTGREARGEWRENQVEDVAIVLGGLASAPVRAGKAEEIIRENGFSDEAIAAAAEAAFTSVRAMDNTDFGFIWRKEMVRKYVTGALRELRESR